MNGKTNKKMYELDQLGYKLAANGNVSLGMHEQGGGIHPVVDINGLIKRNRRMDELQIIGLTVTRITTSMAAKVAQLFLYFFFM